MCEGAFEHLKLREYTLWSVYLHENQFYLGRAIVKLNRHLEDPTEISDSESTELFKALREYRAALRKTFAPDLLNLAFLGNRDKHVHLHIIPRYSSERLVEGTKFRDAEWGNPFDLYKMLELSPAQLQAIARTLRCALHSVGC